MAISYASVCLSKCDPDAVKPDLVVRGWFNPDYSAQWFTCPCLISNIILIALTTLVALLLAREREEGTMDQLHLTPYTPFEMLMAKGVAGVLVGILQALLALVVILYWFKIPFTGDWLALGAIIFGFLLCAVGLGLLISVYSANLQQAAIITTVATMPLSTLSGLTTPVACMPTVFQWFANVNPVRYAVDASLQLFLEGGGFSAVWPAILILSGSGVILFFFAWNKFRKM